MAFHQQRDRPPTLGRQLQPAGRGEPGALGLADHRAQSAVAQSLLHDGEHVGIVMRLGIDHPPRRQPDLRQPGGEQVAPAYHPQHRTPGARGDSGKEQRGGGIVAHVGRRPGDLVQRIESQSPGHQLCIDRADPERQSLPTAVGSALDRAQFLAQTGYDGGTGHAGHDS